MPFHLQQFHHKQKFVVYVARLPDALKPPVDAAKVYVLGAPVMRRLPIYVVPAYVRHAVVPVTWHLKKEVLQVVAYIEH